MASTDGRATRWAKHNAERRRELVESALRAIRRRGHGLGMDELAAEAGTSKTVFYRHFGDRNGLYAAVVDSVQEFILGNLSASLASDLPPAQLVAELSDAYLAVVEADGEIYRFVTNRPGDSPDPVLGITNRIGNEVSAAFRRWLEAHDLDPEPANIWGHGAVGFIWAVADRWILTDLRRPRADLVNHVTQFFTAAFAAAQEAPTRPTEESRP